MQLMALNYPRIHLKLHGRDGVAALRLDILSLAELRKYGIGRRLLNTEYVMLTALNG